jgi:hypothetical protein
MDRVRRVEAPAEPDLEQHRVEPGLGEEEERRSGRRVEERRRAIGILRAEREDRRADPLDRGGERRASDLAPVDAETLGPAQEVRRREGARAEPRAAQQRLGEKDRRALPLRARDVDRPQRLLGAPDAREECADRIERETRARALGRLLVVDQLLEPALRLLEGSDGLGRATAPCTSSSVGTT